MTTETVPNAIVFPQSTGTGLSSNTDQLDAVALAALARYQGGQYVDSRVASGLAFQNHDGSNDTVDVGPGLCFVSDDSLSTTNNRDSSGTPQGESTSGSGFDFSLADHSYLVILPTATTISVSSGTLNSVHVDVDVTGQNSVTLEHDGLTVANPGATSLKIGETNPDDATADTRANDRPALRARSLSGGGSSVAVSDSLDLQSSNDIQNAGSVSTEQLNSEFVFATDETELQNALDNNAGDDSVIIVPVGDISVSSQIDIKGGNGPIEINGFGSAILTLDDGANDNVLRVRPDGVTIKNLTIEGNKANQTDDGNNNTHNGIYATAVSDLTIENITVKNTLHHGIYQDFGNSTTRIRNCVLDSCGSDNSASQTAVGVLVRATNDVSVSDCDFIDCYGGFASLRGVSGSRANKLQLTNCYGEGAINVAGTQAGFLIFLFNDAEITDCRAHGVNNASSGIAAGLRLEDGTNGRLTGLAKSCDVGLQVAGAGTTSVAANDIVVSGAVRDGDQDGFRIGQNVEDVTVSGSATGFTNGLFVVSSAANILIDSANLVGNSTAIADPGAVVTQGSVLK